MEGIVGSGELSDRSGGGFLQYDTRFQGRKRNGYHLPRSQAVPSTEVDDGGVPLQGFTLSLKIL